MEPPLLRLQRASALVRGAFLVSMFGIVFLLDYLTGYQVNVFGFYVMPVVFSLWLFGRWAGIGAVFLALLCWAIADIKTGHGYSESFHFVLNIINRTIMLLFVVLAVIQTQRFSEANARRLHKEVTDLSLCTNCHSLSNDRAASAYVQDLIEEREGMKFEGRLCLPCLKSCIESNYKMVNLRDKAMQSTSL